MKHQANSGNEVSDQYRYCRSCRATLSSVASRIPAPTSEAIFVWRLPIVTDGYLMQSD
jgi:hypothetical protein